MNNENIQEIDNELDKIISSNLKCNLDFNVIKNNKNISVCFTGHRQKFLPFTNYDKKSKNYQNIRKKIYDCIIECINNGYTYFISGVAQGIDLICAELVLEIKRKFSNIKLECAIPYPKQYTSYDYIDKLRYKSILTQADYISIISPKYSTNCMMKRNKYMVDNSSMLIGVWNGNQGGTKNTIEYANKNNIPCKLILI